MGVGGALLPQVPHAWRWVDVAPTLVAGLVGLLVLATAGLAWMLIACGIMIARNAAAMDQ
jgi:hypothetical protein